MIKKYEFEIKTTAKHRQRQQKTAFGLNKSNAVLLYTIYYLLQNVLKIFNTGIDIAFRLSIVNAEYVKLKLN